MEGRYKPDFLQNLTATCISATPKPYASISDWLRSLVASAICVSTILIRQKKKQSTLTPSWPTSNGWVSSGTASIMPRITSNNSTNGPFN